jgi:hypothetical protein
VSRLNDSRRRHSLHLLSVTVLLVVSAACGATVDSNTCHGMTPAAALPDRVGGFEFGVVHDVGRGNVLDLTDFSGCELPDGQGIVVLIEGTFASAYHLDCEHLTAADIPAELRPEGGWLCYGPGGGFEKAGTRTAEFGTGPTE